MSYDFDSKWCSRVDGTAFGLAYKIRLFIHSDRAYTKIGQNTAFLPQLSFGNAMKSITALVLLLAISFSATASSPKCDGANDWAASMAFVHLKNAGLIENETTNFSKTKVVHIASEKLGKNLYRQVHDVTFIDMSGKAIEVITVNNASHQECSMSGVDVFVVSKKLGGGN